MVSSYLERRIRTLEKALEDQAPVRWESPELGHGTPAGLAVDRYDPIGVQIRPLANEWAKDNEAPRISRKRR